MCWSWGHVKWSNFHIWMMLLSILYVYIIHTNEEWQLLDIYNMLVGGQWHGGLSMSIRTKHPMHAVSMAPRFYNVISLQTLSAPCKDHSIHNHPLSTPAISVFCSPRISRFITFLSRYLHYTVVDHQRRMLISNRAASFDCHLGHVRFIFLYKIC